MHFQFVQSKTLHDVYDIFIHLKAYHGEFLNALGGPTGGLLIDQIRN